MSFYPRARRGLFVDIMQKMLDVYYIDYCHIPGTGNMMNVVEELNFK